jgi:hypothetical protein
MAYREGMPGSLRGDHWSLMLMMTGCGGPGRQLWRKR